MKFIINFAIFVGLYQFITKKKMEPDFNFIISYFFRYFIYH